MRKTLILLVASILVLSCKKDEALSAETNTTVINLPDTIVPLSYFPAYPNSEWIYDVTKNGVTTTETHTTNSTYQLHSYIYFNAQNGSDTLYSDSAYVPFYNGEPIYGYSRIKRCFDDVSQLWSNDKYPFMSEKIEEELITDYYGKTESADVVTFNVMYKYETQKGDSIIGLMKSYNETLNYQPIEEWEYYQKGVGLISYYYIGIATFDTLIKQELVSYTIDN
jgi:hypothetical protein